MRILPESSFANIECGTCGNPFSLVLDEEPISDGGTAATLGHLVLVRRLGAGSFGTVWKARDTELDRMVAVKVPRKDAPAKRLSSFYAKRKPSPN